MVQMIDKEKNCVLDWKENNKQMINGKDNPSIVCIVSCDRVISLSRASKGKFSSSYDEQ